jgi:predicted XRE-type DNA-binding protein
LYKYVIKDIQESTMQIRELSKPITSKTLNESLAKSFGYKLNLEQFDDIQLSDVQNKLRTEMSQFEVNESFDTLHTNPKYQKTRALLDVINQAVMERAEGKEEDQDTDKEEPMKKASKDKKAKTESANQTYFSRVREKARDYSVPEGWIDRAISRMELGESDQEELSAELQLRYDLNEDVANHIVYLEEGEAEKAETIMATKDMVDRITGWLEDVAAMKAEQLLELLDSIRENQGSDVAQQYQDAVKPALESIYSALENSRQGLSGALSLVSGGEAPMMGAPTPGMGTPPGGVPPTGAPEMGGELGAEETPPAPEVGREKRESVDYSRRLGILLASKKN